MGTPAVGCFDKVILALLHPLHIATAIPDGILIGNNIVE